MYGHLKYVFTNFTGLPVVRHIFVFFSPTIKSVRHHRWDKNIIPNKNTFGFILNNYEHNYAIRLVVTSASDGNTTTLCSNLAPCKTALSTGAAEVSQL